MIVEVVLPGLETKLFSGGDVLRKVVEVGGVDRVEVVGLDGFLVEVGVRFDGPDFLGKVVMMEEGEALVFFEEVAGVKAVGVREQDETVSVAVELLDDVPHRVVQGKDVEPGFGEDFRGDLVFKNRDRAGDEFFLGHGSGLERIFELCQLGRERCVFVADDLAVEIFKMEFEEDVADIEEESHGAGILERMSLAASRAAAGLA